jgi:hypothetical protein
VKSFLDDLPTLWHPKKSEEIRHANAGTGQLSRPVCDFDPNHCDRFEDVDAHDARFYARCWSISINPIEQKFSSNGELIPGITEERCLRVEGGTHQFALALLAAVDVQLESLQDLVMLGWGFWWCHVERIRRKKSGHQRTRLAKMGAPDAGCWEFVTRLSGRR